MEKNRKKEIINEWKNRHPEMGVISVSCKSTGESFLGISKDIKADFNSIRFKLFSNYHPNKQLLAMWKENGKDQIDFSVVKMLKYDNPQDDQTAKLKDLLEECLRENPVANRL